MTAALEVPVTTIGCRRTELATETASLSRLLVVGLDAGTGHQSKIWQQPRTGGSLSGVYRPCGAERS